MSENAEEPSQKRQRFANLESEDLNSLLDTAQAQSTKYNTAYAVSVYEGKIFWFYFVFEKNISSRRFYSCFVWHLPFRMGKREKC